MNYCIKVDTEILGRNSLLPFEDNKFTNITISLNNSFIWSTMQPNQTNDYDLLRSVENLQK